jgi:hypothetical protein
VRPPLDGGEALPGCDERPAAVALVRRTAGAEGLPGVALVEVAGESFRALGEGPAMPQTVRANRNETWKRIDYALRVGQRGLPGGDSLPQLLARERGLVSRVSVRPLTGRG